MRLMSLPDAEPVNRLPELYSLQQVGEFLDAPTNRNRILYQVGYEMAQNIHANMAGLEEAPVSADDLFYELDTETFERLFDPALPTIVLDGQHGFLAHELVGLAAADRRERGESAANVLYIVSSTNTAHIAKTPEGASELIATHGILVDTNGFTYCGELPTPVRADIVDSTNRALLRQCRENGIPTISPPDGIDKRALPEIAAASGVVMAQRYEMDELWADDLTAEYVIKPNDASGGRGVRMFAGVEDKLAADEYFAFLKEAGYDPIVESRVRTTPLYLSHNGEQVEADWNVRVLMFGKKVLNMYIRAGRPGGAINADQGASEFPIDSILHLAGSEERGNQMLSALLEGSHKIAQVVGDFGLTGGDVTLDQDMQPTVFEVNDGNVGGPRAIARFELNRNHKLLDVDQLLTAWAQGLQRSERITGPEDATEPLRRDIGAYYVGLYAAGHYNGMCDISEEELTQTGATHWDYSQWLLADYSSISGLEGADRIGAARSIDEDFIRLAPLEFPQVLAETAYLRLDPEQLLAYADTYQRLSPTDRYWNHVRIAAHAQLGQPEAMRQVAAKMSSEGVPQSDLVQMLSVRSTRAILQDMGLSPRIAQSDMLYTPFVWMAYLGAGYEAAARETAKDIKHTTSDTGSRILTHLGIQLAIDNNDSLTAQAFAKHLATFGAYRVTEAAKRIADRSQDPNKATIAIGMQVAADMPFGAMLDYLRRAPSFTNAPDESATQDLATLIAERLQQADQAQALSHFLRTAVADPANVQPLTQGAVGLMTQAALVATRTDRRKHLGALFDAIDGDPTISNLDQLTMIDILAKLTVET